MNPAAESGSADRHLGESLAALIDGELCHDSRERVLAHLATCPGCKAEADAQRRLKSVFAESALPPPSDRLLARLQGLPAAGGGGEDGPPSRSGASRSGVPGGGAPGDGPGSAPPLRSEEGGFGLDLLGGGRRASLFDPPALGGERGFRIHEPGAARVHRGHRLAFAAAGAVSLAAFAIGGAVTAIGAGTSVTAAQGAASAAGTAVPGGAAQTGAAQTAAQAAAPGTARTAGTRADQGGEEQEKDLPPVAPAGFAPASAVPLAPGEPAWPLGHPALLPLMGQAWSPGETLPRPAPTPGETAALGPAALMGGGPQASATPRVHDAMSPR